MALQNMKLTPWSELGRVMTTQEWDALCRWRTENPDKCPQAGDPRGDRVFVNFDRRYTNGEHRMTPDQVAYRRRYQKQYRSLDAVKKRVNNARRERYETDENHRRILCAKASMWRRCNWPRAREHSAEWARKNKAKHRATCDRWIERNRERARLYCNTRRRRYRDQLHPSANKEALALVYRLAQLVTKHTGIKHDVDHIIPISSGGWHHELNVAVVPRSVNRAKQKKPFWTSDQYLDWRDVPEFLWPAGLAEQYRELISEWSAA